MIYQDVFEFLSNKSQEPGANLTTALRDFEKNFKQKMMRGTEAYITSDLHARSRSFANIKGSMEYPSSINIVTREE